MIWMFAVKNRIKYCVWNKLCLVFNIRCRREKSQKGQQLGSLRHRLVPEPGNVDKKG